MLLSYIWPITYSNTCAVQALWSLLKVYGLRCTVVWDEVPCRPPPGSLSFSLIIPCCQNNFGSGISFVWAGFYLWYMNTTALAMPLKPRHICCNVSSLHSSARRRDVKKASKTQTHHLQLSINGSIKCISETHTHTHLSFIFYKTCKMTSVLFMTISRPKWL